MLRDLLLRLGIDDRRAACYHLGCAFFEVIAVKLNVGVLQETLTQHLRKEIEVQVEAPEGVLFPEPFKGMVDAYGTAGDIFVNVQLEGKAQLECSRCLAPMETTLRVQFDEEFRPGPASGEGEMVEDEEGNLYSRYSGDEIDLTEPIRQQVVLGLPMKALCKADCAGLCPICGGNRNDQACTCVKTEVDPRLAVLQQLLPPDHNSK